MVIYCCHRKEPDSTGAGNAIVCVGGLLEGRGGLSIKENSSSRVWGDGGASSGKLQAQISGLFVLLQMAICQSPFQTGGCDSAASGGEISSLGRSSALNGQFFILILFVFSEWWWAD